MSCWFICEILWFSMANRRLTRGSRCFMYLDDGLLKSYLRAHDINVYVYVNIYIYTYIHIHIWFYMCLQLLYIIVVCATVKKYTERIVKMVIHRMGIQTSCLQHVHILSTFLHMFAFKVEIMCGCVYPLLHSCIYTSTKQVHIYIYI